MKKHILSILLGLTLISSMTVAPAFAETVNCQKSIENVTQLKSAIALAMTDGELSDEEEALIMAEATEEVVADLLQEKLDEAVEILSETDMNQDMQQLPDGSEYGCQTYDLGDGCQVTVELRDQAEGLEPGTT